MRTRSAPHLAEFKGYDKADQKYLERLLNGVIADAKELEAAFGPLLDRPVDELSPVERGVLLIGAYELAHVPDVPYKVVINEAVELAKSYGGTDGHKYVNGVLDKLAAKLRAAEVKARRSGAAACALLSEFDIIRRYFTRPVKRALLGVGDDCALIAPDPGTVLAVSTDMLVEGRHFLAGADAAKLGHKALAVNLSDLAAMGAAPRYATLALALPEADAAWLAQFSQGFFRLADAFGVELIGGDTTRGPRNISMTVMGTVPPEQALRRDGAKAGDEVWLSGASGDAALALAHLDGRIRLADAALAHCLARLHTPVPCVALGLRLRGIATSAIDVSDGLVADVGHIAERSGVEVELRYAALPRSRALRACADARVARGMPARRRRRLRTRLHCQPGRAQAARGAWRPSWAWR